MKILYIGQYTEGTTSKMRANALAQLFNNASFQVIDIHTPFHNTPRLFKSFGARFKKGPLIKKINSFINEELKSNYDLIWVDKGTFITKSTLLKIKKRSSKLIHYTPDMAFYINKSTLFINNMSLYDYVITTKTAELDFYKKHISENKIIVINQGFDKTIHKKHYKFEEKEDYISFIGHFEEYRGILIKQLIDTQIQVKIVGKGWNKFVAKNKNNSYFSFVGDSLFSEDYSKFISKSIMSLGFFMKRVPELHTTRTFEIPACHTALLTEKNSEIESFYTNEEVIFYKNIDDLIEKIKYFKFHKKHLKLLTENGYAQVLNGKFDYQSIIVKILNKTDTVIN